MRNTAYNSNLDYMTKQELSSSWDGRPWPQ